MAIVTGTVEDDILNGTSGADYLSGRQGADKLYGGDGNDVLWGEEGNDILDGGSGADEMYGGIGDDTYIVDSVADKFWEGINEGYDTVIVNVDGLKIFPWNIEKITFQNGVLPPPYWIDALLFGAYLGTLRSPYEITYGFLESSTNASFRKFSDADKLLATAALSDWVVTTNLTVKQVADPSTATLSFGYFDLPSDVAGRAGPIALWGQSLIEVDIDYTGGGLAASGYGYHVLQHEIGHALGLKHPGEYHALSDPGPFLPKSEDLIDSTVMSYNGWNWTTPILGPLDYAAAQYMYGVNENVNAGDTVYKYTSLVLPSSNLIGDGSGIDTIDASDVVPQNLGATIPDMTIELALQKACSPHER